ncbi:MAG: hypothetical protein JJU05_05590 [Verrucomicrobia bacterium]|nr:hypothetical protein [Verrucomicrobiota bacterium]MCH8525611.1 hypothetical protein [Kiritimatiellia bacterium]
MKRRTPPAVIEERRADLCDEQGRIDVTRPAVLEIHRELIDAMFTRFPQVDGLVIRVGETYLFDTPHHGGNTAVPLHDSSFSRAEQADRFTRLLQFLREEVCVRHGRTLIHRTWDYFPDRLHADPAFYQEVTDAVAPHEKLVFSIKHVAGDFWRGCVPNPCLGLGRHPQIVEVQCAREYEGKGAYPNYIARGVIEGFPEVPNPLGLKHWRESPLFRGGWTWSRGGGWYGPFLTHEFWPDLNTRVLAAWTLDPAKSERLHFEAVCRTVYGMDAGSVSALRKICDQAEEGIWLGRSIPAFARLRKFADADCALLWMRDDKLGGLDQLGDIFRQLEAAGMLEEAVEEKREAARIFAGLPALAASVMAADPAVTDTVRSSAEYGARLFALIAAGWEILARRWRTREGIATPPVTPQQVEDFQAKYDAFCRVAELPQAASLYELGYWHWPDDPAAPGMGAEVFGERG